MRCSSTSIWLACALAVPIALTGPLQAQDVTEIQIAPVNITLEVGEQRTFLATVYDARGNPMLSAHVEWRSLDERVVQLTISESTPNAVTATAVGVGVTQIEAQLGAVRSQSSVEVVAAPILPDSVLPPAALDAATPSVARIESHVFGLDPTCAAGAFVDPELLVTSYSAIRGADSLTVRLADGRRVRSVRVAAYDVAADLAVVHVPGSGVESGFKPAGDPEDGERVWAVGYADCRVRSVSTRRVERRGDSVILVDRPLLTAARGTPIVDSEGQLMGLAIRGTSVIPAARFGEVVATGRAQVQANATAGSAEVAGRENHRYGSIAFRSEVRGASARVTPLEDWQWSGLVEERTLPFIFTGPVGRYSVELITNGVVRSREIISPEPGVVTQIALSLPTDTETPSDLPAGPPVELQGVESGGKFPIGWLVVGLAAAAGGSAFLLTRGGDEPPNNATGGIRVRIPVP